MKANKYQDLIVWQKAMDFAERVYGLTKKFPAEEKFGLTSQLNRSSVSIASNIAEGAGRDSRKEFSQFYPWQWVPVLKQRHKCLWQADLVL
jgi:hypothetical protein